MKVAPHTEHFFACGAANSRAPLCAQLRGEPSPRIQSARFGRPFFTFQLTRLHSFSWSDGIENPTKAPKINTPINTPPRKNGTIPVPLRPRATVRKSPLYGVPASGASPVQMSPFRTFDFQDRRNRPLCHPSILLFIRNLQLFSHQDIFDQATRYSTA